jgi:hypothetical protein
MRSVFLLPLATVVAVAAGCGSQVSEQAARSAPQRDLTLAPSALAVDIASPVELKQLRIQHRTVRPSQRTARPASARRSSSVEPNLVLAAAAPLAARGAGSAPVLAVPEPAAQPVSPASDQRNDRELLPGKTVTLIPASSGPSTAPEWTDELPPADGGTMVVRGGGRCRPPGRGPGIGIAAAPRPDFR